MQSGNLCGTYSAAQGSQVCHCEAPKGPWRPEREARGSALGVQSREGSCDFADGFPVVRPCSARLPRRFAPRNDTSGERAVHQCTCAVELPSARCSGNAAAFPIGAISRFLRKKISEAQASDIFSNTINHNQLFTSRRPSSGGRSGAGRPHSPEPSGPRAAACSNR